MTPRATSTVLDAAVFLLLVTAAVATLTAPVGPVEGGPPRAGPTAELLSTTTTSLWYSLAPGARQANEDDEAAVSFPVESSPEFRRSAHGTHASLLADAAVGNVTVGARQLTHANDGFESGVTNATENVTRNRVAVRAVWTPYRGAPVAGRLRTGRPPPVDADVSAVTVAVASDLPSARDRAGSAARSEGYDGVARVVARTTIKGLFPPNRTRLALHGDYPVTALMTYRYRRAGRLLGVDVADAVEEAETTRANERLAGALAGRFARDMRRRFPSPEAAARTVRVGEVRLVVRRWSA